MTLNVHIGSGDGKGGVLKVTPQGEMAVSRYGYDETEFRLLDSPGVAYNFYGPRAGYGFVITVIRARANRQVSTTVDADVVVFENATGPDQVAQEKVIHQEALVRGENFTLMGLNYRVTEGRWVNATTTDDDVTMTIMGYYIPLVAE